MVKAKVVRYFWNASNKFGCKKITEGNFEYSYIKLRIKRKNVQQSFIGLEVRH